MLFRKTVSPDTLELLNSLMAKKYLQQFTLVGGTSLALQIGHRLSLDLDMFTTEPFETSGLKLLLQDDYPSLQVDLEHPNTLITTINGIKVDFIRFKYGFDYPLIFEENTRLADIKDIAAMKLDAISGRGKKKDFFDLFFLLKRFSLHELLEMYQQKYKHTTIFHVIKSINYFEDSEGEPDPVVIDSSVTWETVKMAIVGEVQKLPL